MTRTRYVYDHDLEEMVPLDDDRPISLGAGFNVIPDIQPFKSPIDGSEISSRSSLRAHERKHNVRQLGNDWSGSTKPSWWDRLSRKD